MLTFCLPGYTQNVIVDAFAEAIGEKIEVEIDPSRVRKVERMHLLSDVTKLKSLGWEPQTGIEEGIKTLVE